MSKRILITSTDLMMIQFLVPHVINLADKGYEIEIACSNVGGKIEQIKERKYPDSIAHYTGDILLVGINYDKKSKAHQCAIERYAKQ